jgi:cytochrome P450
VADAMEAAEQLNPLRSGVVHMQDLPVAERRTKAYEMTRSVGPVDFERKQKHYAFGGGPHTCVGSHLARLKMRVVLEEWHSRIPDYRLGPGGSDRVEWPAGLIGIDILPLVFPPRGSPA